MQKKSSFIIFGFTEDMKRIVVKHEEPRNPNSGDSNAHWKVLVDMLGEDIVGYAVTIIYYVSDRRPQSDIVFISWAPSGANIKLRMITASSVNALKPALVGIRTSVQANSKADLDLEGIVADKLKGQLLPSQ
ncbi:hypothetical protein GJ496_001199 [Pomphorhynchus laevis]|nr:hypothetical protein GJ496_001199 [Pomphorhynchus laevis]